MKALLILITAAALGGVFWIANANYGPALVNGYVIGSSVLLFTYGATELSAHAGRSPFLGHVPRVLKLTQQRIRALLPS